MGNSLRDILSDCPKLSLSLFRVCATFHMVCDWSQFKNSHDKLIVPYLDLFFPSGQQIIASLSRPYLILVTCEGNLSILMEYIEGKRNPLCMCNLLSKYT